MQEIATNLERPLTAEVVAIGDELTTGQRLDTNTQWLATRLTEAGLNVLYHTTVADDMAANLDVLRAAAGRADVVVSTGGLGPTADDLTRDAIAAAADVELVEDAELVRHIEGIWTSRGRTMPPQNRRQACLPEGATAIPNPGGTAPGVDMRVGRARVFALPGVPAEMREMWDQTVGPAVIEMSGGARVTRHWLVRCFGAGESAVEAMIPELIARGREPLVGITASQATITLRVTASGADDAACAAAMAPTLEEAREKLGPLVFAEHPGDHPDVTLQEVVVDLLRRRGLTLATHERMTGGLLAHWLATADPVGDVFLGGTIGSVPVASGADFRVAVGAAEDKETPIAIETSSGLLEKRALLVGHPSIHRSLVAKHALNHLRLELIKG